MKNSVALCVFVLLLTACQGYEVTLNERQIYQPAPVLTEFRVADSSLQSCLDQTIKDQKITHISELTQLSCTHAGIKDLTGIEFFTGIEALNLADNAIEKLDSVAKLSKLKILLMTNNKLRNADAILSLLKLEELNLVGNPNLNCNQLEQLSKQSPASITRPTHCT